MITLFSEQCLFGKELLLTRTFLYEWLPLNVTLYIYLRGLNITCFLPKTSSSFLKTIGIPKQTDSWMVLREILHHSSVLYRMETWKALAEINLLWLGMVKSLSGRSLIPSPLCTAERKRSTTAKGLLYFFNACFIVPKGFLNP